MLFHQFLNLAPEQVAGMVQEGLKSYLIAMQDEEHILRQKWKGWLEQWLLAKRTDDVFQQRIELWIQEMVINS